VAALPPSATEEGDEEEGNEADSEIDPEGDEEDEDGTTADRACIIFDLK
jgi:hypothetical protein